MIRYALRCRKDHEFEAWFRSNDDFDRQKRRGFVECPACGSHEIEKALMAPKPQGFNLWGYLLPGVAITAAGVALVAVLRRREAVAATTTGGDSPPVPEVSATPEEMDRLRRALAEAED